LDSSDLMDPGDSMSSGLGHDASPSVMADAVNTSDAASSEYRVMCFGMFSVHCIRHWYPVVFISLEAACPGHC
jgi:hypothetical protein